MLQISGYGAKILLWTVHVSAEPRTIDIIVYDQSWTIQWTLGNDGI